MTLPPLVAIVIPAYNAAATLDQTLRAVRAQTHAALEIIVVDDGSRDATPAIAQAHADADHRIRLIRQPNAGVAIARNTGWTAAAADIIAFVDADDLWAPTKIERQLEALAAGGPRAGFVYSFFARINMQDVITERWDCLPRDGDVLDLILQDNFVGNCSSMLLRRETLVACGGFDDALRAAGAQGAEDYLLCCRAAQYVDYAVAAEVLVGYREMPGNMSSVMPRMFRSWMHVSVEMMARHPAKRRLILNGLRGYAQWLVRRAVFQREPWHIPAILWLLLRHYPMVGLRVILLYLPKIAYDVARSLQRRLLRLCLGQPRPNRDFGRFEIGAPPVPRDAD